MTSAVNVALNNHSNSNCGSGLFLVNSDGPECKLSWAQVLAAVQWKIGHKLQSQLTVWGHLLIVVCIRDLLVTQGPKREKSVTRMRISVGHRSDNPDPNLIAFGFRSDLGIFYRIRIGLIQFGERPFAVLNVFILPLVYLRIRSHYCPGIWTRSPGSPTFIVCAEFHTSWLACVQKQCPAYFF